MRRVLDLASPERNAQRDRALGATLAFVAGATNAGGFLAVAQYTSHMTGIASTMAGDLASGKFTLALSAFAGLAAFVFGVMTTAITVNLARRHELRALFALPLLLEAALLLCFGLLGGALSGLTIFAPATVLLLCYLMGVQNAVITKISRAEIRTTHVTGLVTDIGIELGKLLYVNRPGEADPVLVNRRRLRLHGLLVGCFFAGGVAGALGFKHVGSVTALPLALG